MITIGFERFDNGIFVPHVDVLRSLNRTFRRGGINVGYSNGFNRHMSLKMTQPLPFGVADYDSYVTADIGDDVDLTELLAKFNSACPPFLRAKSAFRTEGNPSLAGIVNRSTYRINGSLKPDQIEKINSVDGDYEITVKKKNGVEYKRAEGLLWKIAAGNDGFETELAFGNVNLRIDMLCEQFNADFGCDFSVTDAVRTTQSVSDGMRIKSVESLLGEICIEKYILK